MAIERKTRVEFGRRSFLRAAGLAFTATLGAGQAEALSRAEAVLAAACRLPDGSFAAVTVTETGAMLSVERLPARAHGVTVSPDRTAAVYFARRPGTVAVGLDPYRRRPPATFSTPPGRHFFGHGTFSADGRLLYATENDFEAGAGVVGIYDATDRYRRIGEFATYGIGPHDLALVAGGRWLAAANGGIETHPDFGRAKLNLAAMAPSLALIDASTGALVERHPMPVGLNRLSLRHLVEDEKGRIWFGCQNEGPADERPPLLGHVRPGEEMRFLDLPGEALGSLAGYVGALAIDAARNRLAVTSPRGGSALVLDLGSGLVVSRLARREVCAVVPDGRGGFLMGSYDGRLGKARREDVAWDQHMALLA